MATNQKFTNGFRVNRTMLGTGVVLTGIGAVLSLAGTAIVCATLASAGRDYVNRMETPPSEQARRAMQQAKAASMAGLEAWRTESTKASAN
ncbi:hypothetical protein [Kitasatospora sp. NPDC085879]|uniref:hypothetical protein n=1 Tax=Kitasatospora sp. NPDC085879 TaxID=3154769 RepID=UPI00342BF8D8